MIVTMKKVESWCNDYCKKFQKTWDFECIASDSWLNGFRKCQEELIKKHPELKEVINNLGVYNVSVDFKDGNHQLKR